MTVERIAHDLSFDIITAKQAAEAISSKEIMKKINYYSHIGSIAKEPLKDGQLQELNAIVEILQLIYNSGLEPPVSNEKYDAMYEMLIDLGMPRYGGMTGIIADDKVEHTYKNLRGTLGKTYYLTDDEKRINKSRKYLDEWIKSTEARYRKATGKEIDLNQEKVIVQPKFDGVSAVLEVKNGRPMWITRGDTRINKAKDVSHIMNIFNDLFVDGSDVGIKFEVMMTEENKDRINSLYRTKNYRNSRQIVTASLIADEADFKAEYLYPIPLRIMRPGDEVEQIHPMLIEKFPTMVCKLGERDKIRQFANENRYVGYRGMRLRTDGAVMTILNPQVQKALGRDNDMNFFEVAYKFTAEHAYSRVKAVEFYVSEFGHITPVVVVNDVILKGNTINHISLSNRERFDELNLQYGDEVKVEYDIIPYVTIDDKCHRIPHGRKIEFTRICPKCHEPLDLTQVEVQCTNPNCISRVLGRILNYCSVLRIQNIGYQTLEMLYAAGLLKNGIRSLYKLRKKTREIEDLDGFGKLKTKKMIAEIEAKRRLSDYEFFGALGIEGLSTKTFQNIFSNISLGEFMDLLKVKNFDLMRAKLIAVPGIGESKAETLTGFLKDLRNYIELQKLLEQVYLRETYGENKTSNGRIVFTGCRPNQDMIRYLKSLGYDATDSWSNSAKYLVVPSTSYESSKTGKAKDRGIPIVTYDEVMNIIK